MLLLCWAENELAMGALLCYPFSMIRLNPFAALCVLCFSFLFCSCQQQQQQQVDAEAYIPRYHYVAGQTATIRNGKVIAPENAPKQVKRAIAAANSIINKPYKRGGGHAKHYDNGYDCSGSTSFVLREAGMQTSSRPSNSYLRYGAKGPGKWITVYVRPGHVFLMICGIRFDTTGSGNGRGTGPRWHLDSRKTKGFYLRHPRTF